MRREQKELVQNVPAVQPPRSVQIGVHSVSFTRLRNCGSPGDEAGFQPFRKEPVRVAATFSNEELGEVLLQTLSHCE